MTPRLLLLLALVVSPAARADTPGVQLYADGEYEAAVPVLEQVLAEPQRSRQERGEACVYLAAALHALGRLEEAQAQLYVLAREYPEQRLDPARFLPELVALSEAIRQRVETEREYAERERRAREEAERERRAREEAERERRAREEAERERHARAIRLRPEALGLVESVEGALLAGAGLSCSQGPWEVGARAWLGRWPVFNLQGGWLAGQGALKLYIGLRGALAPGLGGYGAGVVAGGRLELPARLVAVLDVAGESFFIRGRDAEGQELNPFTLTVLAGVGLSLDLMPPGPSQGR